MQSPAQEIKSKIKNMIRKILIALLVILVLLQFYRPARNLSGEKSKDISVLYPVPDTVNAILERACNDCHSNKTIYPWYAEVQPVGWWLKNHVNDGKRHLNFNEFATYWLARQKKKMEEVIEQIKKDEMPLPSYTWIHKDAILSDGEKVTINTWAQSIIDTLKARYPADSLVLPKRQ